MGCCHSATASRATVPGPGSAAPQQAVAPVADGTEGTGAPVLVEVSVRERAIGELKCIFEEVSANEHSQANKAELTTLLDDHRDLDALMKKSDMSTLASFVSKLIGTGGEFVAWEEFLSLAEEVGQEVTEAAVEEATREAERLEEAVAAELEAAEEAKEKVLTWLEGIFESFARDEDGAVSKEDLEARLRQEDELDGESVGVLIGRGRFNPVWNSLSALDTNKDGSITLEELQAHILGLAREEVEKMELVIEDVVATQRCWGCC